MNTKINTYSLIVISFNYILSIAFTVKSFSTDDKISWFFLILALMNCFSGSYKLSYVLQKNNENK